MAIRTTVFVEEQNVSPETEQDDIDEVATHYLMKDESTNLSIATARTYFFPEVNAPSSSKILKIGRCAVLKNHRGKGIGLALLEEILKDADAQGIPETLLDAQTHAIPFYEKLGFHAEGEEFLDESIPHYRMRRKRVLV
ncbi:MAG: GNAT family N-acetyltransferase [Cyanobacteria bacterium]|nr:GNAT family N-acetyltransferase [Cyanobacteriota bacterium]